MCENIVPQAKFFQILTQKFLSWDSRRRKKTKFSREPTERTKLHPSERGEGNFSSPGALNKGKILRGLKSCPQPLPIAPRKGSPSPHENNQV